MRIRRIGAASERQKACSSRAGVNIHAHTQLALALAAVNREHTVVGDFAQGLVIVAIRLIGSRLVGIGGLDYDIGGVVRKCAQVSYAFWVFRNGFGHNVARAGKCRLGRLEASILVDVCRGGIERAALGRGLHDDHIGERFKPASRAFWARVMRFLR